MVTNKWAMSTSTTFLGFKTAGFGATDPDVNFGPLCSCEVEAWVAKGANTVSTHSNMCLEGFAVAIGVASALLANSSCLGYSKIQ